MLNRPLGALLPIKLSDFPAEPGQKRILPGLVETPRGWLDAVLCNTGVDWLLELEPLGTDDPAQPLANPLLGRLLQAPQTELELEHYVGALADVVRHTTGYHRTLVYRFLPGVQRAGECAADVHRHTVPRRARGIKDPTADNTADNTGGRSVVAGLEPRTG